MLDKTWIKKPSNVFIHLWYLGLPRNRELFHSITAKPIHTPQWIRFWLCNTFDFFSLQNSKPRPAGKNYILQKYILLSCQKTFHDTTLKCCKVAFKGLCLSRACSFCSVPYFFYYDTHVSCCNILVNISVKLITLI